MKTSEAAARRAQRKEPGMYDDDSENPFAQAQEEIAITAIDPDELQQLRDQAATGIKSTRSFEVAKMGLQLKSRPDETEWDGFGQQLASVDDNLPYMWGDWLNAGNFEWGAYKRFAKRFSKDRERSWRTIEDYAYICRNVHLSCRHERLSLSHHKVVAPIFDANDIERSRATQSALLQYAFDNNLGKDEFRDVVRQVNEGAIEEDTPVLPDAVIEAAAIPIVIKQPFWQRPLERLEKDFIKRWKEATQDDRQAALKRLKTLVKELERME